MNKNKMMMVMVMMNRAVKIQRDSKTTFAQKILNGMYFMPT